MTLAPDLATPRFPLNRAIEQHNMARFTPDGRARELAVTTLRLAVGLGPEGRPWSPP